MQTTVSSKGQIVLPAELRRRDAIRAGQTFEIDRVEPGVYRLKRAIERVARRKLLYLSQARRLDDLRAPPGNRLEALKGDRRGQHSIRIHDQWQLCFRWQDGDAFEVEIVDYH